MNDMKHTFLKSTLQDEQIFERLYKGKLNKLCYYTLTDVYIANVLYRVICDAIKNKDNPLFNVASDCEDFDNPEQNKIFVTDNEYFEIKICSVHSNIIITIYDFDTTRKNLSQLFETSLCINNIKYTSTTDYEYEMSFINKTIYEIKYDKDTLKNLSISLLHIIKIY